MLYDKNPEFVEFFIECVRDHPVLYDARNANNKREDIKTKVRKEICIILREKGFVGYDGWCIFSIILYFRYLLSLPKPAK